MSNKYDFGQKYQMGGLGKMLINNFYQKLFELVNDLDINNAFEVGAGEGYSSQKIIEFLPKKTKFEISEFEADLIDRIQNKVGSLNVSRQNIYKIDKKDNEFDLVFCLEVLEHLRKPKDALRELHRISNKYVIVSVPNEPLWRFLNMMRGKYWSGWGNTPGHIQHWNDGSLRILLEKYFAVEKIAKPIPWMIFLLTKKK